MNTNVISKEYHSCLENLKTWCYKTREIKDRKVRKIHYILVTFDHGSLSQNWREQGIVLSKTDLCLNLLEIYWWEICEWEWVIFSALPSFCNRGWLISMLPSSVVVIVLLLEYCITSHFQYFGALDLQPNHFSWLFSLISFGFTSLNNKEIYVLFLAKQVFHIWFLN